MRRTMIIVLLAFGLLLVPQAGVVRAQAQVIETHVVHEFGEKVIFTLRIKTDIPIEEATIFFQAYNESHTQIGEPQVEEVDESTWDLVYTHYISDYALPAYTAINYRYDIALQEDGGEIQTGWYSFYYDDNRFEWEVLVEGPFRIYWYDGDLTFAQDVQDAAQEGLTKSRICCCCLSPIQPGYTYTLMQRRCKPLSTQLVRLG